MTDDAGSEVPTDASRPFDLVGAFLAKQNALHSALGVTKAFTSHGTTIGDASEANWCEMLREFLPGRYGVGPIFAVDSKGRRSQQIDVAVYDRQYAPLWFRSPTGTLFIPAESVYAVFEVKPKVDKTYVDYTGDKIASVRALYRTSGAIRHAGGTYDPQDPEEKPIVGGILTVESGWTDLEGEAAVQALTTLDDTHRIDIGIALDAGSFTIDRTSRDISYSPAGMQLIHFAMTFFTLLQKLGTALAVDISAYLMHMQG